MLFKETEGMVGPIWGLEEKRSVTKKLNLAYH